MALRQQSAVEFISTYSFAIFLISIILVAITTISLSIGSTPPIYSTCSIQPLISCQQSLLTYNTPGGYFTYLVIFRNNLGFNLQFPPNAINLSATGLAAGIKQTNSGGCVPTLAGQGSQVLCRVTVFGGLPYLQQGSNIYTQFHLYYGLCTNQSASSCTSNTYSATGYSYQTLSPPTTNLYNVTVSSQNGIVVINGLSYFNNSVVYLTSGAYTIYAQPSVGYHFVSWSWTGYNSLGGAWTPNSGAPFSTLYGENTVTANVIFTLNSLYNTANIVALFTHN